MQERSPLNLGQGAAKRTLGKGTRKGSRRGEENWNKIDKEESEKEKLEVQKIVKE